MKKKYLLLGFLCITILCAYGVVDTIKIVKPTVTIDVNGLSEAKAYKMLYDNQIKSNDAILKTIFYALGGLGTAVLLVFGSTWWFNDKKVRDVMNEIDTKIRDVKKDTLAELTEKINALLNKKTVDINKMQISLQEEVSTAITNLIEKQNKFAEKIKSEIKEDNRVLVNNYQELLKSYNENLTQQIATLKESFEEKTKHFTKQIEQNEKRFQDKLSNESKDTKRSILSHYADISFIKGNYNVALKAYTDFLLFDNEIGYNWSFKFNYNEIIKCLEKVTCIYDDEIVSLNLLIEINEGKYPSEVEKIKLQIKDKPIKKLGV